jgi:tetratricopeptide (TPR) repeat protein
MQAGSLFMSHSNDPLKSIREKAKAAYKDGFEPAVIELLAPYLCRVTDDAYGWYMYGDALRIVGRSQEAEVALLHAAELDLSKRVHVCVRLAHLYKECHRCADAERYYSEAISDPEWKDVGWLWILRGCNLAAWGRYAEAETCHRKAMEMECGDCDNDEAWLNIGLVLRAQGRYAEAIDALKKSLVINSDCKTAQEALRSMEGIDAAVAEASTI